MADEPGYIIGPKRWLVTRSPQPAGTLIKLGSIVTEYDNPETSLTRKTGVVPIDPDDIYDQSPAVKVALQSHLSRVTTASLDTSGPVLPLFSARAHGEIGRGFDIQTTVNALDVKATIFIPTDDYMKDVVKKPEVLKAMRESIFSRQLFIIVGVATASRIDLAETESRDHHVELGADVSIGEGAALEEGMSFSHVVNRSSGLEMSIEREVDFAYRVREFTYSRLRRKIVESRDVGTGALLGRDNKGESETSEGRRQAGEDDLARFDEVENEDIDGEDVGLQTLTTDF